MQEEFKNDYKPDDEIIVNDADFEAQTINIVSAEPKTKKNGGRGVRAFCLILVAVILLSCFSYGGYYIGKNGLNKNNKVNSTVDLNLEKKPQDSSSLSPEQIYSKTASAIVGILIYNTNGDVSEASGVVYSEDGYIVTNDHIYSAIASAKFKIYMNDSNVYDAVYVAGDTRSDLAILKISQKVKLTKAVFGDSDTVVSGEKVCAIGYTNGYSSLSTITTGIVSTPKVRANISSSYSSNFIQTDTAINPGSSGGALMNEYGQIIGIVSSKISGVSYEGVGFAIPSKTVKKITESLIENGNVKDRAKLGISYNFYNEAMAELAKLSSSGLLIQEVSEDSDLYNKVEKGDFITRVNDIEINDDAVILDLLEEYKPNDKILLTIVKKSGETATYSVKLLSDEGTSSYINDYTSKPDQESNKDFNFPEGY